MSRVAILGPGRLGRSLARLWTEVGHHVQLLGRGASPAAPDVVVLTVPDRAIAQVAQLAAAWGAPTLHTSGSADLAALAHLPEHGSLHPLMTFPGPEVSMPDLRGVTAMITGTPAARAIAFALASDIGMIPRELPGDRRLYHAAAVMAGNFATVLLAEAARVLTAAGVPASEAASVLAPLAAQSIRNAAVDPARALTGPIARGDHAVLDGHRAALREADLAALLPLYDLLAQHGHDLVRLPQRETAS